MTSEESVSKVSEKKTSSAESTEKVTPSAPSAVHTQEAASDTVVQSDSISVESTDSVNSSTTESVAANDPSDSESVAANEMESEAIPSIEDLSRQLAEATQQAQTHWDNLLRKQAEFDNLQKRMTRDLENARKYALEKFATELLAVNDSMELGLEAASKPETQLDAVREGMVLTFKMLNDTMTKFGITEINPLDEKFDPQWHEAMAMQPIPNVADGMVLHVHQKGYQLNDRLLRPARVVVAKAIENQIAEAVEKPIENQG
ncbi:MAG: nucleotide exchange factor GrpE [Candidatus Parabeggiatoa sp.]|nr:nucleotide exchange factor GrpE [Candidatus Parabeggiatoa sp.]